MAETLTPDGQPVIKLGRVGHYSTQEMCQTALVTDTWADDETGVGQSVNLAVWQQDGRQVERLDVPVSAVHEDGTESFHLNLSCPWSN